MKAICANVTSEMRKYGLVRKKKADRVQSLDDYCLLSSVMCDSRSFIGSTSSQSFRMRSNELLQYANQPERLCDQGYEKTRRIATYQQFWDQRNSFCPVVSFAYASEEYERIFNQLVSQYLRVRDGWVLVDEIWVFLVESVYNKYSHGLLIFEDRHKLLFRQEVLDNNFVNIFLKSIAKHHA